ncbi:hypothetical protein ACFSQD_15695 [Flavihumibacter stibioxidans]
MEQQFFEDEFEQFLRENADQHRMYPSHGVWTNIYRHFHSGRRRVALGVLLLLILTGSILLVNQNSFAPDSRKIAGYSTKTAAFSAGSVPGGQTESTVTVNDIIAKLRAKSLMPPVTIVAPRSLEPLQLDRKDMQDQFTVPENFLDAPGLASNPINLPALREMATIPLSDRNSGTTPLTAPAAQQNEYLPFATAKTTQGSLAINTLAAPAGYEQQPDAQIARNNFIAAGIKPATRAALKNRFAYTLNFSPSIGYRNLFEGKSYVAYGNSPLMVRHLNVNQFVDHKPAVGFELGGGLRYQVSRILSIRTGLQLNFTRYSIAAFSHYPERATLALNTQFGMRRDTLVATSNVRNLAGNNPERLHNQYLQIGIPVGAELMILGDNKLQVNLAGSLQPSYLLNTDQYLLSSDFSNYVKEPSLLRRWNLATGLEASVSYRKGDTRWHFGPQFRYNLLSTYKKQYPIRENLMEYGVRIGVSKTIR